MFLVFERIVPFRLSRWYISTPLVTYYSFFYFPSKSIYLTFIKIVEETSIFTIQISFIKFSIKLKNGREKSYWVVLACHLTRRLSDPQNNSTNRILLAALNSGYKTKSATLTWWTKYGHLGHLDYHLLLKSCLELTQS